MLLDMENFDTKSVAEKKKEYQKIFMQLSAGRRDICDIGKD